MFKSQNPPIPQKILATESEKQNKARLELELQELEERIHFRTNLPHLMKFKNYIWGRKFIESRNKINLLTAANQVSKSSSNIRRCVWHATDRDIQKELWIKAPSQFWYFYPTKETATVEFEKKWKEFLPNGEYKDDPVFGWKEEKKAGFIWALHFNSGVSVYFKTYSQKVTDLQSGTCDEIFLDEECPVEYFDELMFRLSASDGYFNMVFTATLGQEFWRKCMEPGKTEKEELPQAFKQTVSLYDCMYYEDGTPSHWTPEKIAMVRARCSTHQEVLKRVYGKFVVLGGRKYESFDIKRHIKEAHKIPDSWFIYSGTDIGSGGESGHPAAIVFVAVKSDYRQARVFLGWRGDGIKTTAGDVINKHEEMVKEKKLRMQQSWYDWASADFTTISIRAGLPFERAEKGHEKGEEVLNTLFKHDALFIYEDEELVKLVGELSTLKNDTPKKKAHDDFVDALRYCCAKIPWDFPYIIGPDQSIEDDENPEVKLTAMQQEVRDRRKAFDENDQKEKDRIEDEFSEWNDAYG